MSIPYVVKEKIVQSGRFFEYYQYERPYWVGFPRLRHLGRRVSFGVNKKQTEIRADNVRRTRTRIRRLVNSNPDLCHFLTLTFNSEVIDLNVANPIFERFVKRWTRLFPGLKYLAVPEFQTKSRRVHYHIMTNYPFKLSDKKNENFKMERQFADKVWKNGFVKIVAVDRVDNLGAYISKYLTDSIFDPRYFKKKKFFKSANLAEPVVVDNPCDLKKYFSFFCLNSLILLYRKEFYSEHLGMIEYRQYKTHDSGLLKVGVA